jgi:hypothetical protein
MTLANRNWTIRNEEYFFQIKNFYPISTRLSEKGMEPGRELNPDCIAVIVKQP